MLVAFAMSCCVRSSSCRPNKAEDGPLHNQQWVGSTYKQLAAVGHAVGMKKEEYVKGHRMAKAVSLRQRHTNYILKKLSREAA